MNKTNESEKWLIKGVYTMLRQLGHALFTILKTGGKVVIQVNRNRYDPWEGLEDEPTIPDWLKK